MSEGGTSRVTSRDYAGDADFPAVRQFLTDNYRAFGRILNWGQERWDIQRYSVNNVAALRGERFWESFTHLWEVEGSVVGVVHPEDGGDLWLEVDPDFRHLEDEMFAWGEAHPSPPRRAGQQLVTFVESNDTYRQAVLEKRGWTEGPVREHLRERPMRGAIPEGPVPPGYVVRALDLTTTRDSEGRAAVSRASFGNERTGEMMKTLALAPGYDPDLDLAAIAPDGTFAAYTTVWWDAVNRYVVFEPVGTHSEYRRLGLASAVIAEGLRRAEALGADTAFVGSGAGRPSNVLYEGLGFAVAADYAQWGAPGDPR